MRRTLLLFIIWGASSVIFANSTMDNAESQGESFATSHQSTSVNDAKNPDYNNVPNYEGTNVPEANYSGDLTAQAREQIATGQDKTGVFVNQSIQNNPQQRPDQTIINNANQIQANGTSQTGSIYCADDSCTNTTYTSEDRGTFDQDLSALSGLMNAGSDSQAKMQGWFRKHVVASMQTFKGNNLQCHDSGVVGDYNNCCSDNGWGQWIGLAGCSNQEKTLGQDKEKDLCVYVGKYCSHKDPIIGCTVHKKSYCCFDTILAKVIQEQGRQQLNWSFGKPDSADCRGFTPAQLQRVDFSKINFNEFYYSLETELDIPASSEVQQELQQDLQTMFSHKPGETS